MRVSYTVLSVLAVDILALVGDLGTTWTSPMFIKMSTNSTENPLGRPITEEEEALLGSLSSLGSILGTLPFGWICQKFGRKVGLLSIAIPHLISYLMYTFSKDIMLFNAARLLSGIAIGGGYVIIPLYVAEISDDSNRGKLSATVNISWTLGSLIPLVIGPFLSVFNFNLIICALPFIFFIIFCTTAPESPYHLLEKNKGVQAEKCLVYLRNGDAEVVENEMLQIKEYVMTQNGGILRDIFQSKSVFKGVVLSIILVAFQEFTGIVALLSYVQPIFEQSKSSISSDISSVVIGLVIFFSSFTTLLADRVGRKILIIISSIGTFLCNGILGLYYYLLQVNPESVENFSWAPLVTVVLYMLLFAISIPWTVSSELLPSNMRSTAATVITLTYWVCEFIVTRYLTIADSLFSLHGTFWFFSGCCFASAIFTIFFIPETKGKSLSQIQTELGVLKIAKSPKPNII